VHRKTTFEFLNHTASEPYEIIYIDPPYEVANSEIEKILKKILTLNLLNQHGVVAIERDTKAKTFTWPDGFFEEKIRSYGAGSIHYGALTERTI
jgi:16S rRNA (guanine966-N2)-methyltransferase